MKDCPSCGVAVPESARECPTCAAEIKSESDASVENSSADSAEKRTQMGFPASSKDESEHESAEKTKQEGKTTQFGLPASDRSEEQPEEEAEHGEAGGFDSLDWSDVDDDHDSDSSDDDLLSAWGISAEGSVATTPAKGTEPTGQQREAEPREGGREAPNDADKRTQMGMPRFDPDRISSEHDAAEPREGGSLGNESTTPGVPQQSEVGFDEADRPNTRDVSAGSLRDRARKFEPDAKRSEEPHRVAEDESAQTDAVPPLQGDSERSSQSPPQSQSKSRPKAQARAETEREETSKGTSDSPDGTVRGVPTADRRRDGDPVEKSDPDAEQSPAPGRPRAPSTDSPEPDEEANEESEQLFQTIEEGESDAFEEEDLEAVDDDSPGLPAPDEFDFFGESESAESKENETAESSEDGASLEGGDSEPDFEPEPADQVEPPRNPQPAEKPTEGPDEPSAPEGDESAAEDPEEPPEPAKENEPNADDVSTGEPDAGEAIPVADDADVEDVAESGGRIPQTYRYLQSALAVGSGLAFSSVLGLQAFASELSGPPLVVALTIVAGLGGAAHLVLPWTSIEPPRKSALYGACALIIGGLVVATLVLETATAQGGAYLALGGAIAAFGAAIVPVVAPETPY